MGIPVAVVGREIKDSLSQRYTQNRRSTQVYRSNLLIAYKGILWYTDGYETD